MLLLLMGVSGTCVVLGYLLSKRILKKRIDAKKLIWMLRLAILFFLCPFQKILYEKIPYSMKEIINADGLRDMFMVETFGISAISVPNGRDEYIVVPPQIVFFAAAWMLIAVIVMLYRSRIYFSVKKKIKEESMEIPETFSDRKQAGRQRKNTAVHDGKKDQRKRFSSQNRKVKFYVTDKVNTPCTLGLIRPCILVPNREYSPAEREWIVLHETTHIRHGDVFWKWLCVAVCILHWYNPAAYYLMFQYGKMCEYYCDADCLDGKSHEEKREYAGFLSRSASSVSKRKRWIPILGISDDACKLKKRIDIFLLEQETGNMKKRSRLATLIIVFCCILSTSTVLAYAPPPTSEKQENSYLLFEEEFNEVYGVKEEDENTNLDFSQYTAWFVDEEGNAEPFIEEKIKQDTPSAKSACKHVYKKGYIKKHISLKDGGCKVLFYAAKKCNKCEKKIVSKNIHHEVKYTKCPPEHNITK